MIQVFWYDRDEEHGAYSIWTDDMNAAADLGNILTGAGRTVVCMMHSMCGSSPLSGYEEAHAEWQRLINE